MNIPFLKRRAKLIDADGNCIAVVEVPKKNNHGWLKALIPIAIMIAGGLIGYGQLKERVDTLKVETNDMKKELADTSKRQAAMEEMFKYIAKSLDEIKANQEKLRDKIEKKKDK